MFSLQVADLKKPLFSLLLVFFLFNLGVGLEANSFYSEWPFPIGMFAILLIVILWNGLDVVLPPESPAEILKMSFVPLLFFGVSFLLTKSPSWRTASMVISTTLFLLVLIWGEKERVAWVKTHLPRPRIDKDAADSIIEQLASVKSLLAQGRAYGVRVVVPREAIEGLMQSTHPDAAYIVAKLKVDDSALTINGTRPYPVTFSFKERRHVLEGIKVGIVGFGLFLLVLSIAHFFVASYTWAFVLTVSLAGAVGVAAGIACASWSIDAGTLRDADKAETPMKQGRWWDTKPFWSAALFIMIFCLVMATFVAPTAEQGRYWIAPVGIISAFAIWKRLENLGEK